MSRTFNDKKKKKKSTKSIALQIHYSDMLLSTGVKMPPTGTATAPEARRDLRRCLELQPGEEEYAGSQTEA